MLKTSVILFVCAFAFLCGAALADGGAEGSKSQPKPLPTTKDKQRAVDATVTWESPREWSERNALGSRGPPRSGKNWDDMTPAEKEAAREAWRLNSGDFGKPGRAQKAAPKSVPATK